MLVGSSTKWTASASSGGCSLLTFPQVLALFPVLLACNMPHMQRAVQGAQLSTAWDPWLLLALLTGLVAKPRRCTWCSLRPKHTG